MREDDSGVLSATKLPEEMLGNLCRDPILQVPTLGLFADFDDALSLWENSSSISPTGPPPTWTIGETRESGQSTDLVNPRYDAVSALTGETVWSYTPKGDLDASWVLESPSGRRIDIKNTPNVAAVWELGSTEMSRGRGLKVNNHDLVWVAGNDREFTPLELLMRVPGSGLDGPGSVQKIGHFQPRESSLGCPAETKIYPGTFVFNLPADLGEPEVVAIIVAGLEMLNWRKARAACYSAGNDGGPSALEVAALIAHLSRLAERSNLDEEDSGFENDEDSDEDSDEDEESDED